MNDITIKKYRSLKDNKDLRDEACAQFMHHDFYPTEIAQRLSIDIEELGLYVFGKDRTGESKTCWHYLREKGEMPKFLSGYEKIKPLYIKKTEKKILDKVNVVLDSMDDTKLQDMDTKDLNNLVTAMEKVDRIGRLEEGKSTQNVVTERTSYSLREIIANRKSEDNKRKLPDVIVKESSESK